MREYLKLLGYVRVRSGVFVLVFVLTVVGSLVTALQPWPIKILVDNVLGHQPLPDFARFLSPGGHGRASTNALLAFVVVASLSLFIVTSLIDAALTWAWTLAGRGVVYQLASDLLSKLQRRSLLFHARSSVGDTMSRITVDCWAVHKIIDTLLFAPGHALLVIAAIVFLMFQLNPTLALLALVTAPLMVLVSFLFGRQLRTVAQMKRDAELRIVSHIQTTLTGVPVIQSFTQEAASVARFEQYANAAVKAQQRGAILGGINGLTSGLITVLGTGLVLFVGATQVVQGELTVGSFLVFLAYLTSLQVQFKVFANIYPMSQGLGASVTRVNEVLDAPSEVANSAHARPLTRVRGEIKFENVGFEYQTGRPVLDDISFHVQPGEFIAVVGATGAGKSTLLSLLPRFFDPTRGRITLDGHDIREVRLEDLRMQIAIVLQEPFLFPFSVAENIAYGRAAATRQEITAAAEAAGAHSFIAAMPRGYDTVIGERGGTLSGGERQRIAVARALLKDAPVLILDEPTSALDSETERHLMQSLELLAAGRTTFVIAHRLSTVRRADRIVVLERGRIIESGSHDQLVGKPGAYAAFYAAQGQGALT